MSISPGLKLYERIRFVRYILGYGLLASIIFICSHPATGWIIATFVAIYSWFNAIEDQLARNRNVYTIGGQIFYTFVPTIGLFLFSVFSLGLVWIGYWAPGEGNILEITVWIYGIALVVSLIPAVWGSLEKLEAEYKEAMENAR